MPFEGGYDTIVSLEPFCVKFVYIFPICWVPHSLFLYFIELCLCGDGENNGT